MKPFLSFLLFASFSCWGQSNDAISYQAVARNNSGALISNQIVSVQFSIRDSISTGLIVYQESHTTITNSLGLFSLSIGNGSSNIGNFNSIEWGINSKFLQVEIDTSGGINYVDIGTQQMLSVPYALFCKKAGTVEINYKNGIATRDLSLPSGIQTIPHGLGKTPRKIKITAIEGQGSGSSNSVYNISIGTYDGNSTSTVFHGANNNVQNFTGFDTNRIIVLHSSTSSEYNSQVATATFDSLNIYLSWTKVGFANSGANILWEAE